MIALVTGIAIAELVVETLDFLIAIFKNPKLSIGLINMGKKYFFCKRRLRYLFKKTFC